jgi:rare lipoprotein A
MVLVHKNFASFSGKILRALTICGAVALASACASTGTHVSHNGSSWGAPKYGNSSARPAQSGSQTTDWQAVARANGAASSGAHQKIGRPYTVSGKTYVPARDDSYNRVGTASWYGPNFHGKKTANGEVFDQNAMTAAHPTLPLPSVVRVTNLDNGKQILVRINDRGPFVDDRMIDLSKRAATELGYKSKGTAKVRVEYVGPATMPNARLPITRASATTSARPMVQPAVAKRTAAPKPVPAKPEANVWPDDPKDKYKVALSRPRTSVSGWFVQAGAYSDRQKAEKIAAAMQVSGQPMVQTAWVSNRYIHRVLVGPYASKPQAEAQRSEVVAAGFAKARVTEQN